ncbi:very short patch repair endonuclease [Chelativorans sp. AA-79]|uniref:very short patch repair endonuclease n=1 Tax=Chelativorans sp. AA-79 TaxID=3028735 RepID=UPI0023F783BB|nr:very short patch repair endonuclease [Chelativorans sp. AA-79]WEX09635.1 very short patch repair endonuclease [Chelativorans sp. AA-79]
MADLITPEQRSANMALIRSRNTLPEILVRRTLHRLGYRFRIHWKNAPGRPDIALPNRKCLIQVHGCFWHQHPGCAAARIPTTRREFWKQKLEQNRARDLKNQAAAEALGWRALIIWECELRDLQAIEKRLVTFLGPTRVDQ